MPFISYAQNHEDVLLWRALGAVAPDDGFYIDVGASDPVEHSVTKAFHDAGWRGINIEPLPVHAAAFAAQRPRDIHLALAAGSADGSLVLYDVPAVRGWASPDPAVAAMHRAQGHAVAELTVPVRTLASICAEYVNGEVHFLKIDVEGFEEDVLRGMDFGRWRPWVLVIEATLPNSRVSSHAGWEPLVTAHAYRFAWFDGLNRYYVAQEHADLLRHFSVQPNVFDDYLPYHLVRAWEASRHDGAALAAGGAQLRALQDRLDAALARAEALAQDRLAARTDALQARADTVRAQAGAERARSDAAQAGAQAAEARAAAAQAQAAAIRARREAADARTAAALARRATEAAHADALQAQAAATRALAEAVAARADGTAAKMAARIAVKMAVRTATRDAHAAADAARSDAARARGETTRARAALVRAQADIALAHTEIARLHGEHEQAVRNGRQAAAWARELEARLLATLASTSWRVTQPLRDAGALVRRMRSPGLARRALGRALGSVTASERMRRTLVPVLLRHPALGRRVADMLRALRHDPHPPGPAASPSSSSTPTALAADVVPDDLRHLPASVRAVLLDLRRARADERRDDRRDESRCAS